MKQAIKTACAYSLCLACAGTLLLIAAQPLYSPSGVNYVLAVRK